jgi:glycerol-3-phosphate dehydrogenase
LPTSLGKGVLVTPTVDGNLLIGPNAANQKEKDDLSTTREGLDEVYEKAMLSINSISMGNVITSFSGLRARTSEYDFIVSGLKDSSDFINVIGIESPGLSSAPAIGVMVGEMVEELLHPTKKENFIEERKGFMKFSELNDQEKESLIKERKDYGRVVCRCEMVTEGEIIDAIRRPLGATNLDGVKRRTRAGAGRCQAGFCTARILQILSEELSISPIEVTKFGAESKILVSNIKDYL